jgi:peroxiredoxin family protein
MTDSIAVVVASDRAGAADTALNLLAAAVAMEMDAHVYFTGDAVVWVGRPAPSHVDPEGAEAVREDVARRVREIKEDGALHVYACTRAMQAHGISGEDLAPEVDMPAGFAFFLGVMEEARFTLSF